MYWIQVCVDRVSVLVIFVFFCFSLSVSRDFWDLALLIRGVILARVIMANWVLGTYLSLPRGRPVVGLVPTPLHLFFHLFFCMISNCNSLRN